MNHTPIIGIGDVLMRPKFFGLVQHCGVFVGGNAVLTNTPSKGEHLATLNEFSAGERITLRHSRADPWTVIARSQKILANPKRYDPICRNCEHTANEAIHGTPKSPIVFCLGLLALAGVIYAVTRRS